MIRLLALLLFFVAHSAVASDFVAPTEQQMSSAISTFKFKGEWISPKIIQEFLPWESDHEYPLVLSIDVSAATGTNRYFGTVTSNAAGATCAGDDGVTISYEWIGRLKNGLHVLVTKEYGSGTMVATHLAVFELRKSSAIGENEKAYPQLVLELKRIVVLGDRAVPTVTISGNDISVRSEFNTKRNPEIKKIKF